MKTEVPEENLKFPLLKRHSKIKYFSVTLILRAGFLPACLMAFLSLTNNDPVAEEKYASISSYIDGQNLKAKIKSLGGHSGNCLEFNLTNISPDTLFVLIEPGRRILSADSTRQDILIVKEKKIILSPYESRKVTGYGFCCCARRGSPHKDSDFNIGYMAPPTWIKLAEEINKNNFPPGIIQSSIWALSDNHSIASIHDSNSKWTASLRRLVASVKGGEIPWYSISYEEDTSVVFTNRPEKVWGDIEYYLNKNAIVTMNVRSKNGRLMATIIKAVAQGPGKYFYQLEVPVKGWPAGEYDINIYEDFSNLNYKKSFKL